MTTNAFGRVKMLFEEFGYTVLKEPDLADNNCDMVVVGKKKVLRVEIKQMYLKQKDQWQADCVSENQKQYDCVAVVFPNGYVFLEKMSDYVKSISDSGYRQFNWLKLD